METILIINTGGTFNKRYNPLKGELQVPDDSLALDGILKYFYNLNYKTINIIHKDSLDMNNEDREEIAKLIQHSSYKKVIIVHGTDTMDKTAEFLDEKIKDKCIVLTGAMVPFSIEQVEATTNISTAIGYMLSCQRTGVYIAMHGLVNLHDKIFKNREIGVFQSK
ncbi:MAG: asparaginase domain-containing protein [Sulfurospirillaceae bacterium]|nr:asparaginase domain-containing protein [Sulfurospirillaceae bacterium]